MRLRLAMGYSLTAAAVLATAAFGWATQARGDNPAIWTVGSMSVLTADQTAPTATSATATTTTATLPLLHANPVTINATGFWSWALLDRRTNAIVGSTTIGTTQFTASMIKAWLAADYLRLAAARGQRPATAALNQLSIMIRDSDNAAASATYITVGQSASIRRLISICGLTDSRAGADWAHALVSARDAVRMGQCIADGRAAGSTWTTWVLTEMRNVRGDGRFGIIDALPTSEASQTSIKNGWVTLDDDKWHINCLAIGPDWVLAVETVYPIAKGMGYGTATCTSVAKQLMATA